MTFTTLCRLLSQAVIHSRQPVALNWARNSFGLVLTVFLRKICILGIAEYFLIVLFQISEIKKDEIRFKKYIFLLDMFLIVGGEGSSNRNASRDESVEAGDKSVEAGDESIEAGEKTPQSCYNLEIMGHVALVAITWNTILVRDIVRQKPTLLRQSLHIGTTPIILKIAKVVSRGICPWDNVGAIYIRLGFNINNYHATPPLVPYL